MPETAKKTLRDRIAHLRKILSETDDVELSREHLNEIVMAEARLRELESRTKKKPRKKKSRSDG